MDEAPVFDNSEFVLRASKRKQIKALFVCLAFVGIGVWEVSSRAAGAFGWLCTLFFGLGGAVFTVQLMPGASYLRVRIPAMPITNSNLMAISIPIDADHHRSEATLG